MKNIFTKLLGIPLLSVVLLLGAFSSNVKAQCPNNNALLGFIDTAPWTPGMAEQIFILNTGEAIEFRNMICGATYEFSTCTFGDVFVPGLDTQLDIYSVATGVSVASNDDACGLLSRITFTPTTSGSFDVLVDEFNCLNSGQTTVLGFRMISCPTTIAPPTIGPFTINTNNCDDVTFDVTAPNCVEEYRIDISDGDPTFAPASLLFNDFPIGGPATISITLNNFNGSNLFVRMRAVSGPCNGTTLTSINSNVLNIDLRQPQPAGMATITDPVCQNDIGSIYTANAFPDEDYAWDISNITTPPATTTIGGAQNESLTVDWNGIAPGAYDVTMTPTFLPSGCQLDDTTFTITVNPNPAAPVFNPTTATRCQQDANTMVNITNPQPNGTTYDWQLGGAPVPGIIFNDAPTNTMAEFPPATPPGVHNIDVTATNSFGCQSADVFTLTVEANPAFTFDVGPTLTRCQQDANSAVNINTACGTCTFDWQLGGAPVPGIIFNDAPTNSQVEFPPATPVGVHAIDVTGTDPATTGNCATTEVFTLTVNENPTFTLDSPTPTTRCQNAPPTMINATSACATCTYTWELNAAGSGTPVPGIIFNDAPTNSMVTFGSATPAGNYTIVITITDPATGCETSQTFTLNVNPNDPVNIPTTTATRCQQDPNTAALVIPCLNTCTYEWQLAGAAVPGIVFVDAPTNSQVEFTPLTPPGIHPIDVIGTNAFGCRDTGLFTLTVFENPPTPTLQTTTSPVCPGDAGSSYAVTAQTNTTYNWNIPAPAVQASGGTSNAITVDWDPAFPAGNTALDVTAVRNGCLSVNPLTIPVVVNDPAPATPSAITSSVANDTVCIGTSLDLSVVNDPTVTNYDWRNLPPGAFITAGTGTNNITINFSGVPSGNYTIDVEAQNDCGVSPAVSSYTFDVIGVPPAPGLALASPAACTGQLATFAVNTPTSPLADSYSWANSCSWTGASTTATIDYNITGSTVCLVMVNAVNQCGNGPASYLFVTPEDVPAQPSPINGPTPVCVGGTSTYSVLNVPGVNYMWTGFPAGATVTGAMTNAASVDWTGVATGTYTITVEPSNDCGTGLTRTFNVEVIDVPAAPGAIAPITPTCQETEVTYTVPNVIGNSYNWNVTPSAGAILAPADNSLKVTWDVPAGSYDIEVSATNQCGTGPVTVQQIVVEEIPVVTADPTQEACGPNYTIVAASTAGGLGYSCANCPPGVAIDNFGNLSGMQPGQTYLIEVVGTNGSCAGVSTSVSVKNGDVDPGTVGIDQTVCSGSNASVSLSGNTGSVVRWERSLDNINWTPISNTSPNFTLVNLTQTTFIRAVVQEPGTTCPEEFSASATITVVTDVNATATPATQEVCADNTTVTGNLPAGTTGTWTYLTGPAAATPAIGTAGPTGTITGMTEAGTYTFRWTLDNAPCPSTFVDAVVIRRPEPSAANAGFAKTICESRTILIGNVPAVGTGNWTFVGGSGVSIPNVTTVNNLGLVNGLDDPGVYTFQYEITSGNCTPTTSTVNITRLEEPTIANAGVDQTICASTVNLTGNIPAVGTGSWSVVFGPSPVLLTPLGAGNTASVTGMNNPGQYLFRYQVTNGTCPPSFDDVVITVAEPASPPTVPITQVDVCDVTSTLIYANKPTAGVGSWTFISGPSAATITTLGSSGLINGMINPGDYQFGWTVSNPSCGPGPAPVIVTVTKYESPAPTTSSPNDTICENTPSVNITGAAPVPATATGTWHYVSGPVANVSIAQAGNTGTVTNMTVPGDYKFEWRVTNGNCPASISATRIEVLPRPTTANAGLDKTICGTETSLAGNTPVNGGTPNWTLVSAPGGATPSINVNRENAFVSGMDQTGPYVFEYSITTGTQCPTSTDQVTVNVFTESEGGFASADQTVCAGTNSGTITLTGTNGTVVRWESSTNGFASRSNIANTSNTQIFTNLSQTTQYQAVVKNGNCPETTSQPVTITVNDAPSPANAGPDQFFCGNVTSTILIGSVPASGTGTWTQTAGPGASFTQVNNLLSVSGLTTPGTYTFRYEIANAPCAPTFDEVDIVVDPSPAPGFVVSDQTVCEGLNSGTLTLTGFTGTVVRWESSTDNFISKANLPPSTTLNFSGLTQTTKFRAIVQSGNCPETPSETATITVTPQPTVANAGPDQSFCGDVQSTILAGNPAINGAGSWSFVSTTATPPVTPNINPLSPGGEIVQVTGMTENGVYTFAYEIANAPCPSSTDIVTVERFVNTVPGTLNGSTTVCTGLNSGTLTLSGNTGNVLYWETSNDNFVNIATVAASSPNNVFVYSGVTQTTQVRAVVQAGSCPELRSSVAVIAVTPATPIPSVGPNQTACLPNITLTATPPSIGSGTWSIVTGPTPAPTIVTPNSPSTAVTNLTTPGTYIFRYTIANAPCPSTTADVQVIRLNDAVVADAGPDQLICTSTANLTGNNPGAGTGSWSLVSQPTGLSVAPIVNTVGLSDGTISGMTVPGDYVVRYTISTPPCPQTTDELTITVQNPPSAATVPNTIVDVCDNATVTITANNPMHGTGTWSYISGPTFATISTSGVAGNISGLTQDGTYVFRWTVTNPPCTGSNFIDVTVNKGTSLTTNPFAGSDQSLCNSSSALVVGNAPPSGATGTWTLLSQPAGASANVIQVGNFASITSMTIAGDYELAWTFDPGGACAPISDVVTITRVNPPTPVSPIGTVNVCGTSTTLVGTTPVNGTPVWSFITGPVGVTPAISQPAGTPNATISNMTAAGTYIFRYAIENPPCAPSVTDVTVNVSTGTFAGSLNGATTVCGGSNSGSLTLTGFTGNVIRWESSTDNFSSVSLINNTSATQPYSNLTTTTCYRAVVQDGTCGEVNSNFQCITVEPAVPAANAGPDQTVCSDNTMLMGNNPGNATANWSFVVGPAGASPVITSTSVSDAMVTGLTIAGTYVFEYEISSAACGTSTDVVILTVAGATGGTVSGAATVCSGSNSGSVSVSGLTGNVVRWEVSTDNINFAPIANTGSVQGYSNLTTDTWYRAVVQTGSCPEFETNSVKITVVTNTIANAGPNQTICGSTTMLNANVPVNGTGAWSFVSGPATPTINPTPSTGMADVTGMTDAGLYVFRWTITNPPCAPTTSDVVVDVSVDPIAGTISGGNVTVCSGNNIGTLTLTGAAGNIIRWESSPDNFTVSTTVHINPTTNHTYVDITETRQFRAVLGGGACPVIFSPTTTVFVDPAPAPANAGPDQTVCGGNVTLTGSNPGAGTPSWNFISGPATPTISTAGNILSASNLTATGLYVFEYSVSTPSCGTTTDNVVVNVLPAVNTGTVVGGTTVCSAFNSGFLTLTGFTGSVVRWESSNDGIVWTPISNTTNVQVYTNLPVTTSFRAVVQNGGCPGQASAPATVVVSSNASAGTVNGSTTVCSATNSGTLTLTGTSGNVVRWESSTNGFSSVTSIPVTSTSYTFNNVPTTTQFRAVVQFASCPETFSSPATVTVSASGTPGTVTGGGTICSGNSATFTLNGNSCPVTRWETSTDGWITVNVVNNTTNTLTLPSVMMNTSVRAVVQCAPCPEIQTPDATVFVTAPTAAGTVSGPATVCSGSNGTLTLTGNNGNVVRWEVSADGFSTINTIAVTTNTLTFSNASQDLSYRAFVQNGTCPGAFTNQFTVQVQGAGNPGTVTSSVNAVCSGSNSGTLTLTGQTGSVVRWESSTDNFGSVINSIANTSTTQTFSNLTQTTQYRAIVSSGSCPGAASNSVTITVDQPSVGGQISGTQPACGVVPAAGTLSLTGFTGSVVRWESSTDNFTSAPNVISNTSSSLSYSVTDDTYYRAIVQNGSCTEATSAVFMVDVRQPSNGGVTTGSASVCQNNNSGTVSVSGFNGNIIRWESSTDNFFTTTIIPTAATTISYNGLSQTTQYRAIAQVQGCTEAQSTVSTITVNPALTLAASPLVGCNGGSGSVIATASGGTGSYTYSISPPVQPANSTGRFDNLAPGTYTVNATDGSSNCSGVATVTIGTTPTPPVITNVSNVSTTSGTIIWTSVPPVTGVEYTFRYRVKGATNWTTISNLTSTFVSLNGLQSNTTYEIQVAVRCPASPTLTSFSTGNLTEFTTLAAGGATTCASSTNANVPVPGGVFVNNITGTQAQLNWSAIPDAAGYIVSYGLLSAPTSSWPQFTVCNPQTTFLMSGLSFGTDYGVRIRTNCSNCTTAINANDKRSVYSQTFTFATSSIRGAALSSDAASALKVYPNPNNGVFTVSFEAAESGNAHLSISNVAGQTVLERPVEVRSGLNTVPVEMNGFATGVYILQFRKDGAMQTTKVVVE